MSANLDQDYLDEDKPLKHMVKNQNFCVISMLTPNCFPEANREQYKDQKILGLKIRGTFETYDEAKTQAAKLQKLDKFHNVFVGEVGKWLPFDVDISNMQTEEDAVYREKSLNKYMKAYKDSLSEEEITEKQRKEDHLKTAKVVTGDNIIPDSTGLGKPIVPDDNVIEAEQLRKVEEYANLDSSKIVIDETTEDELSKATQEKVKLTEKLEESKINLQQLEEKLSTINNIYAELKK